MIDGYVKKLNPLRWLGFDGIPQAVRKPDGYTRTTGPNGEHVDCDTLQCCHCGGHFEVIKGSGRLRGFCPRHNAVTCGRSACMVCIDREERLENLERGLPELTLPTSAFFGQLGGAVLLAPKDNAGET